MLTCSRVSDVHRVCCVERFEGSRTLNLERFWRGAVELDTHDAPRLFGGLVVAGSRAGTGGRGRGRGIRRRGCRQRLGRGRRRRGRRRGRGHGRTLCGLGKWYLSSITLVVRRDGDGRRLSGRRLDLDGGRRPVLGRALLRQLLAHAQQVCMRLVAVRTAAAVEPSSKLRALKDSVLVNAKIVMYRAEDLKVFANLREPAGAHDNTRVSKGQNTARFKVMCTARLLDIAPSKRNTASVSTSAAASGSVKCSSRAPNVPRTSPVGTGLPPATSRYS